MSRTGPKWGGGNLSARRRRLPAEPASQNGDCVEGLDLAPSTNDDHGSFDDDPFESIRRALDRRDEDARRREMVEASAEVEGLENMSLDHEGEGGEGGQANAEKGQMEIPTDVGGPANDGIDGDSEHLDEAEELEEPTADATAGWRLPNDKTLSQHKATSGLPRTSINESANDRAGASKRVEENGASKKSMTPPRFTFQSQSTAKPRRSTTAANGTVKTPSNRSLPSRALFPSSTFSTRTSNTTTKKASTQSTAKRKHRHSFRPSSAPSATPAAKSNVREMGFAPAFLPGTKGAHSPNDAPADDEGDFGGDTGADGGADFGANGDVFARNLILGHQQRQRAERRSEASAAGALVQRLRALRNDEQRMAMRLRSGQYPASTGPVGGSALMSRKRRRSGGESDPKNAASSTLDVTVSGISISDDKTSPLLGEGRTLLLAYVHQRTVTKQPSVQRSDATNFPCYAHILVSHDVMREQGIVDGGTKQLRFYDAVVIPPRVASLNRSGASNGEGQSEDAHMPTIVCTHLCQAVEEPLDEVSFVRFA